MRKNNFKFLVFILVFILILTTGDLQNLEKKDFIHFDDSYNGGYAPGQFIVKLKKDFTLSSTSLIQLLNKHKISAFEEIFPNCEDTILDNIYLLHVPLKSEILSIVQDYFVSPDIVYAEPDWIMELCGVPNDANFSNQWYLYNTGQSIYGDISGTLDADIDATDAWNLEKGDSDTIIAILDTGVDYTHPDLASKIWNNTDELPNNSIDDDNNGYIDDVHGWNFDKNNSDPKDDSGHGTMCAGLAAAATDNEIGIAGVGWNCTIMPIKNSGLLSSNIAKGIKYATDNGAKIISMSFGMTSPVHIIKDIIDYAYGEGVFLCASAGNGNVPQIRYPAAYPKVVGVAATNQNDTRCTPKDTGKLLYGSTYGRWIDIAAPGTLIYTTTRSYHLYLNNITNPVTGKNYSQYYDNVGWGTSFSCPLVAGAAALLLSVHPSLTPQEVKTFLCKNTDPYTSFFYIGTGRLNVYKALADLVSDLSISLRGGMEVKAIITNNGLSDMTDIHWQLSVYGGNLGAINKSLNGTLSIDAGESETISSGRFFGWGQIIIGVKADIVEKTIKGKQVLFFSYIK